MTVLLLIVLSVLFFLNVPIAIALGLSTTLIVLMTGTLDLSTLPHRMFTTLDSFPLLAAPFFILAGKIMEHGGISEKIVSFANSLVGHFRGGLGHVSVVACMFFAALSGSAVATTAAVGGLLVPAMVKAGYDRGFSASVQAAGGTTGVMIPPSVPMVMFAVSAGVSVGDLFIAGIVPGILVGLTLMIWTYIYSVRAKIEIKQRASIKEVFTAFAQSVLAILMPIIILGGIYGGYFTPTEASVIAVVYGLLVGALVYRQITWNVLKKILLETVTVVSALSFIIATASFFGFYLTIEQIPQQIGGLITNADIAPIIVVLLIVALLLVVGMFMDEISAIIILTPILLPVVVAIGMDPIHFGVIMVINLAIGLLTPPVGLSMFVAAKVANIEHDKLIKPLLPFIFILVVDVLILYLIPEISLGLLEFQKN